MKVTSHGEYLVQITRQGWMNAYLVREDDGLTLVDTHLRGSRSGILDAAQQHGAEIRRIALTHAHGDHTGSVDEVVEAVPGLEVLISTRDARFIRGDKSLDPAEQQGKARGALRKIRTEPTRTFEAGERIGSLEVIAAPGHTPGHVAFLDTRDGSLIAGDAFTTIGQVATTAKAPWQFPFAVMGTWHKPTEIQTAKELRGLDPTRLAVGHGKVVENPGPAMDEAILNAG